jgi:hypothetical protein
VSARTRGPRWWTVLRDISTFGLGWGLIYQQALFVDPTKVNPQFLWVAATLISSPVGAEALTRLRALFGGTRGSGSDSSSRASSSSSSGTTSDDE